MKLKILLKFLTLAIFYFCFCSNAIVLSAEQKKQPSPNISNQPSTQTSPTKQPSILTPQRKPEDTNINVQDIPVIKSFTIRFEGLYLGGNQALAGEKPPLIFTWDVESGVGGSSISSIVVEKLEGPGPEVNFRTSDSKGSRALNPASPLSSGKTIYKITVTNQIGRSTSSTAFIEVFALRQALEKVQLTNIAMPETEMGKPFDMSLTFSNTNKFPIFFR